MNNIIDIIENNNYYLKLNCKINGEMNNKTKKEINTKTKYIFVNYDDERKEIRLYYKDYVWHFTFPLKNSEYNYKTIFTSESECREYIRQILEYIF
jgi:hypothetical protein